jgi:hypothetical protein
MEVEMVRKLVDMAHSAEAPEVGPSLASAPLYDYGLHLCFNQSTLDKLDLDTSDVEVGDMLDLRALCKVTSVSKNDTGDGEKCRVELVLSHIGIENESTEYGDEDYEE